MLAVRRHSRLARWIAPDMLTALFRVLWAVLVLWTELGVFYYAISRCDWPDAAFTDKTAASEPTHLLLVADAKCPPPADGIRSLRHLLRDAYLRKSWAAASRLHPDVVIFLGDVLSAGSSIQTDDEYTEYVRNFHDLLPLGHDVGAAYYVPGNTDVGLGVSNAYTKRVRERYVTHFGPLNQELRLANHSLILIDAPGLVDEDYVRAGQGASFEHWVPTRNGPVEFVRKVSDELEARRRSGSPNEPVVLLSHIPLHRPEAKKCGPLRERGSIRRGVGKGWQATLGKQTSHFLLSSLRPSLIFSGDDRDYCDIRQTIPDTDIDVQEVTLKSFSQTKHIEYPGLQLLSLMPHPTAPQHAHTPCLLPSTRSSLRWVYLPFLLVQILCFSVATLRRAHRRRTETVSPLPLHSPNPATAKDGAADSYSASSAFAYAQTMPNSPRNATGGAEKTRRGRMAGDDHRSYSSLAGVLTEAEPVLDVPRSTPLAVRRPRLRAPVEHEQDWARWTWTFTFRGQRRRVGIRVPVWLQSLDTGRLRGGLIGGLARDLRRTLWVPLVVWAGLLWLYA